MIARRIYWLTMPYWGWATLYDDEPGSVPPSLHAYPLSWIHRLAWWWLRVTGRDTFGPRFNAFSYRYPDMPPKPWQ